MFISGTTGRFSAAINGFYEPTQEKGPDGRVLYAKRGNVSIRICHFAGDWLIEDYILDRCYASVVGSCALEACTSRVWMCAWEYGFYKDPALKMVTGAEAERQVRRQLQARLSA